jgi:hypothetical protein
MVSWPTWGKCVVADIAMGACGHASQEHPWCGGRTAASTTPRPATLPTMLQGATYATRDLVKRHRFHRLVSQAEVKFLWIGYVAVFSYRLIAHSPLALSSVLVRGPSILLLTVLSHHRTPLGCWAISGKPHPARIGSAPEAMATLLGSDTWNITP